jgi:hypothetical protein
MFLRKKRQRWTLHTIGWLIFCAILHWFSGRFLKAARRLNTTPRVALKNRKQRK